MSQPVQPPQFQPPQPQPMPPPPIFPPIPQKKQKRFGWVALVITALVSLGVGGAVAGSGDSTTTAEPAPTVTVTATPKPAPTKTVADVPQACLDALDDADKGFDIAADMLGVTQATFEIIVDGLRSGDFDIDGINEQTDKLTKLTDRLGVVGDRYNPEKAECRAAAE